MARFAILKGAFAPIVHRLRAEPDPG